MELGDSGKIKHKGSKNILVKNENCNDNILKFDNYMIRKNEIEVSGFIENNDGYEEIDGWKKDYSSLNNEDEQKSVIKHRIKVKEEVSPRHKEYVIKAAILKNNNVSTIRRTCLNHSQVEKGTASGSNQKLDCPQLEVSEIGNLLKRHPGLPTNNNRNLKLNGAKNINMIKKKKQKNNINNRQLYSKSSKRKANKRIKKVILTTLISDKCIEPEINKEPLKKCKTVTNSCLTVCENKLVVKEDFNMHGIKKEIEVEIYGPYSDYGTIAAGNDSPVDNKMMYIEVNDTNGEANELDVRKSVDAQTIKSDEPDLSCMSKSTYIIPKEPNSSEKMYSCGTCQYRSTQQSNLRTHMRTHTGVKPYVCEICKYAFTHKSSLKKHMRIHTGEKPYACNICHYKFTGSGNLARHLKTHTGEKPYTCDICHYKCSTNDSLAKHFRTHTREKPYVCDVCQYKFADSCNLARHMRSHTGEKPYACDVCESKFADSCNLAKHMRTHTGRKPYACTLCDYKSTQQSNLANHMKTHTGEKPYACNLCESKFTQKNSLTMHMRTHTGEKPYACDVCGSNFALKLSLSRHMRTHTGEKPYTCHICQSKFTLRMSLTRHFRTHSGAKPYACDVCQSKYTEKSSLSRHMKSHTGEVGVTCVGANIMQ